MVISIIIKNGRVTKDGAAIGGTKATRKQLQKVMQRREKQRGLKAHAGDAEK